jgi:hypothetical protein
MLNIDKKINRALLDPMAKARGLRSVSGHSLYHSISDSWWPVPQEAQRIGRLDQRAVHPGEQGKAEKERQAGAPARRRQTMTGLRYRSWLPIVIRSLGGGAQQSGGLLRERPAKHVSFMSIR